MAIIEFVIRHLRFLYFTYRNRFFILFDYR